MGGSNSKSSGGFWKFLGSALVNVGTIIGGYVVGDIKTVGSGIWGLMVDIFSRRTEMG